MSLDAWVEITGVNCPDWDQNLKNYFKVGNRGHYKWLIKQCAKFLHDNEDEFESFDVTAAGDFDFKIEFFYIDGGYSKSCYVTFDVTLIPGDKMQSLIFNDLDESLY